VSKLDFVDSMIALRPKSEKLYKRFRLLDGSDEVTNSPISAAVP
jgi:hypothetical protein